MSIKIKVHIINLITLMILLAWGFFLYFAFHFSPQEDAYTAENISILLIYAIWGLGYYIQLTQKSIKHVLIVFCVFLFLQVVYFWGVPYVMIFLETLIE